MDAEQAPNLPPVSLLASMAAIMASPAESSYDTAKRALALWESCDGLIQSTRIMRQYGKSDRFSCREEIRFLWACGLKCGLTIPQGEGFVRLDKFLNACKPSPNSKADDMTASWRAFRKIDLEISNQIEGLPSRSEKELETALAQQIKIDRTTGIPIRSLGGLWRRFLPFRERASKATKSARGKKGGRPKKNSLGTNESDPEMRQD